MPDNGAVMSAPSPDATAREIAVLGSTGSIGTQALDVIRRNPGRFRVTGLAAGGGRVDLLAAQALEFRPEIVAVAKASAAQELQLAFYAGRNGAATPPASTPSPRSRRGRTRSPRSPRGGATWC